VDTSCFEGTTIADGTAVLAPMFDFESGAKYSYEITPSYNGRFLIYYGYSNMNVAGGIDLGTGTLVDTTVTNGTVLEGTFTMPTTVNSTTKNVPDAIIFRTYLVGAQFSYKVTKIS
jgi:hypothetical protein